MTPILLMLIGSLVAAICVIVGLLIWTASGESDVNGDPERDASGMAELPPDNNRSWQAVCPDCDLIKVGGVWKKSGREYWIALRSGTPQVRCTACSQIHDEIVQRKAETIFAHQQPGAWL